MRTPFDFCAFYQGQSIVFDAKTVEKGRFSFGKITEHQLNSLLVCAPHVRGSGYLIWFRDTDQVCFYTALQLRLLKRRESLGPEDAKFKLGSGGSLSLLPLFSPALSRSTKVPGLDIFNSPAD